MGGYLTVCFSQPRHGKLTRVTLNSAVIMISAALFDLDGTLADRRAATHEFLGEQYRLRTLASFGIHYDDFVSAYFGLEREGLLQKDKLFPVLAQRLHLPQAIADHLFQDFRSVYPSMAKPQANALTCLFNLKRDGIRCAVISNGESAVQRPKIETLGLMPFLEFSMISSEVGFRKPDREIFELAASTLGLRTGQCMFVGDNPVADVAGAENAGMHAVFFGDRVAWPPGRAQPKRWCTSLLEVPSLVHKMNTPDASYSL